MYTISGRSQAGHRWREWASAVAVSNAAPPWSLLKAGRSGTEAGTVSFTASVTPAMSPGDVQVWFHRPGAGFTGGAGSGVARESAYS
jgi:hypothetical protein